MHELSWAKPSQVKSSHVSHLLEEVLHGVTGEVNHGVDLSKMWPAPLGMHSSMHACMHVGLDVTGRDWTGLDMNVT